MISFKRVLGPNAPSIFKNYDEKIVIDNLATNVQFAALAHFINPKEKRWSRQRLNTLKDAYLLLFNSLDKCFLYYKNKPLGLPTEKEDFCDPYFLYLICLDKGMKTNEQTSIKDMENYLTYSSLTKEQLISLAIPSLYTKDKEWLCTIISLPKEEKVRDFKNLSDTMRNKVVPLNNEEAIILGACNYSVNLVDEENPLTAYLLFNVQNNYVPLEERYEPSLPSWVYSRKYMQKFLLQEGFDKDKDALQLYLLENSFFFIRHSDNKKLENKESPFYRYSLQECSCPLGYGLPQGRWQFLDKSELIDCFTSYMEFKNPFDIKEDLSPRIVKKLQMMDTDIKNIIELVNIGKDKREKGIKQFTFQDKKENIEQLTLLLHVGFYMRGWDGQEEAPLGSSEVKNQNIIDERVNKALTLFNTKASKYVKDLPLILYDKGYQFSNDRDKGLTVGERINIVVNHINNVNACIRITSNWFVSTAYYYLNLIGHKLPFDIKEMRIIA